MRLSHCLKIFLKFRIVSNHSFVPKEEKVKFVPVMKCHLELTCISYYVLLDLHCLGVCLLAQSKPDDAEAPLREAAELREQYLVTNDKRTGECE